MESGRFFRLLLASLQDGRDTTQRVELDEALTAWDPERDRTPPHPGAEFAWSQEYRRIMTSPTATPEQKAAAREREMARQAARRGG